MSDTNNKRIQIRKSIRKAQIQEKFAQIRKQLLQDRLRQRKQMHSIIYSIANIFAQENPWNYFIQQINSYEKQQLGKIAEEARTQQTQDVNLRLYSFFSIYNIFVQLPQIVKNFAQKIIQFGGKTYGSIQVWGFNKQTQEYADIIALLVKNNEIINISQNKMKTLLQWVEQILNYKGKFIDQIYKYLGNLIHMLQNKYNTSIQDLPELYKSQIINIISLSIQKNLAGDFLPTTQEFIIGFLNQIYILVLSLFPYSSICTMISKIFTFSSYSKESIRQKSHKLLIRILGPFSQKNRQMINAQNKLTKITYTMQQGRQYFANNFGPLLINKLSFQDIPQKIKLIKLILNIIISKQPAIHVFLSIMNVNGLQTVFLNLLKCQDQQLRLDIIHLAQQIYSVSQGRYLRHFIDHLNQHEENYL